MTLDLLDASYIKAHPHSAGARGGNQAIARTKGGSTASCTWRWTLTCRLAVTAGTVADCSQGLPLIEGIKAEHLLADKAYAMKSWNPVMTTMYKLRHLVGERFPGVQAVAGSGDPVCQELPFLPGHLQIRAMIWTKLL